MKKAICTTTIFPPGEAIRKFIDIARRDDWTIFVAGDLKTPHEEYRTLDGNLFYLSPEAQRRTDEELSDAIGMNSIQRRNFAFLAAYEWGAEIIATIDDDNIPLPGWGRNLLIGRPVPAIIYDTDLPAFDPLSATEYGHLWHRGFPLQLLSSRAISGNTEQFTADIQADFWQGDPDIDAICRMEHAPDCDFNPCSFPFASTKPSPFNSQNTFLLRSVLPHYFMMPHVGRMDDIWGGFHALAQGKKVIYGPPSVRQDRNDHNLTRDMKGEYLGYEHNLSILEQIPTNPDVMKDFLPDRTKHAFELYQRHFK